MMHTFILESASIPPPPQKKITHKKTQITNKIHDFKKKIIFIRAFFYSSS